MDHLLIAVVIFTGVFTQTVSGFGIALVSMPLLVPLIGIQQAAPLVALIAVCAKIVMLLHYRESFAFGAVWRLMLASALGIPIGLNLLAHVNEDLVTGALGLLLIVYSLYALFATRPLRFRGAGWAFGLGFASGVLSGAYNTGGPPAVIYGRGQDWSPIVFKANLQAFAMVNGPLVVLGHFLDRNYSGDVLTAAAIALPGAALGLLLGFQLDDRIDPVRFRQIVLVLLIVLGLRLVF